MKTTLAAASEDSLGKQTDREGRREGEGQGKSPLCPSG